MTSLLVAGLCALLVAGQHASGRRRAEQQPTSLHRWLICSQSCQTADALYGACEPAHRCPDHRLRASSFVTLCELGLGHQAVCCPWVRQERVHQHELIQCGRLCATDRSKRALYGTCLYRDECPADRRRLVGRLSACTSAGFRGRVCCPFQPPVLVAKNQLNITHLNGLKSTSPFDNREPIEKSTPKPNIGPAPVPLSITKSARLVDSKPFTETATEPTISTTPKPITKTTSKPIIPTTQKPTTQTTTKPTIPTTLKPITKTTTKPLIPTTQKASIKTTTRPTIPTTLKPITKTTTKPTIPTTPKPSQSSFSLSPKPSAIPDEETTEQPATITTGFSWASPQKLQTSVCGKPQEKHRQTAIEKIEKLREMEEETGTHSKDFGRKIVGGRLANPTHWPWMVLLDIWDLYEGRYKLHCGATLIDHMHVLTAAHCLNVPAQLARNASIRFQRLYSSQDTPGSYGVHRIFIYPNFQKGQLQDDIAILRLTMFVPYTSLVQPICLPRSDTGDLENHTVIAAGWGLTSDGSFSDKLRSVAIKGRNLRECEKRYLAIASEQFPGGFGDTKLCAGSPMAGEDACQGDSGGPLVIVDSEGYRYLVGIVSSGHPRCGDSQYPGIYTRVSSYLGWIKQHTTFGIKPFTTDVSLQRSAPWRKKTKLHMILPVPFKKSKRGILLPPPIPFPNEPRSSLDE
ncbi:transmembrane protease serine 9-like isoform X2 [Amphibalanus amphitrite]|uniref:transmembrane protease serine 9-like isoform X2 n=1 Tax=Amphibalanus amphitrite TaxID=1232801 RepID=UPI001C9245DF|nr:transmembrane protease serine 9-like isoform X2 [Amphibalanus amphitrite]